MPVLSIALAIANHSHAWPMQNLKPTGLPPDNSRRRAIKCINSIGVLKALCLAGEIQSTPTAIPRASAISGVTLAPGNIPPCPGLAPCDNLSSIILTLG